MNIIKKFGCFLFDHTWDKVHGYYDSPDFGAICRPCHKTIETYEEWKAKHENTSTF